MSKKSKFLLVLALVGVFLGSAYWLISGIAPWINNPPRAAEQVPAMSGTTIPVIGGLLGCFLSLLLLGGILSGPKRTLRTRR
jgi:hypothetical protein